MRRQWVPVAWVILITIDSNVRPAITESDFENLFLGGGGEIYEDDDDVHDEQTSLSIF